MTSYTTTSSELLCSDELPDACVHLVNPPDEHCIGLFGPDESVSGRFELPPVNIGVGEDITIAALTHPVRDVTGLAGEIAFDRSTPDGVLRDLMDVGLLENAGCNGRRPPRSSAAGAWRTTTSPDRVPEGLGSSPAAPPGGRGQVHTPGS